ncbi:hypothetical protein ACOQFV_24010 [Nocardiopsis changdeensis]|uniref:Uncharacterized protein n=1 Tax=Nocardiopsis changdeensis TaxID=2831969 RepID=A0A975KT57_9ACTN|nr:MULTISPECIES: hypothetical protein [Nocardiopsis]QUX26540.1 hypothetical protein KGD84_33110 [Nocardiopsis changdeensis]QYX40659.1 hypothetical protein K1J57_32180 [Nocardiopsis sp. MT53]
MERSTRARGHFGLADLADRIGPDGRLPDDIDTSDLVHQVLARRTPAGVYLTQGARTDLPPAHPARRSAHTLAWDWGRDPYPPAPASAPTPQDLRTWPHYWTTGPGRAVAARGACAHPGTRRPRLCPVCEEAAHTRGEDPGDTTTGSLILAALTAHGVRARPSTEGDCVMVDLGAVRVEITDAFGPRYDYPPGRHRGFCAQVVHQDEPYRNYLVYASADRDAVRDADQLARTVARVSASR